ncbi:MAG: PhzF family phenazine biosynthesis protein [Steroidobacteraceae bacterium]
MAAYSYRIVNVFTQGHSPLSGNPLCVFEKAQGLDTARMQALALQFNLSETTFILPSEKASAAVRIFTPEYEMQFAGHPTLGTAHVCRALGLGGDRLTLEMPAGVIPVRASGDRWTLQANPATWREVPEPRLTLAAMLGLEQRDIGERPLWVNAGKEFLIVPLTSEAAVRRANVRVDLLGQLHSLDGHSMAYVFAPAGAGLLARFFFPQGRAVREDPATGAAVASLGGWCLATGRTLPLEFDISQGEYVGRPSALRLQVNEQRHILVSGDVIELGRGWVEL